jgi:hypothetical protein
MHAIIFLRTWTIDGNWRNLAGSSTCCTQPDDSDIRRTLPEFYAQEGMEEQPVLCTREESTCVSHEAVSPLLPFALPKKATLWSFEGGSETGDKYEHEASFIRRGQPAAGFLAPYHRLPLSLSIDVHPLPRPPDVC